MLLRLHISLLLKVIMLQCIACVEFSCNEVGLSEKAKGDCGGSVMVGSNKDVLGRGYVLTYDNCCVGMRCIDTVEASQI